ncbi:glycosyltransferase family 4 protein [Stigmatella erecta]|uniref:Glycosyltransferase involved in cell wall bisynthesis n=1 Tax=Stigmatella erecta TaxID=83460 RepID=A0A1I0JK37_9BACT|nr:glycosyltransferase family 4 protein [Stigmatella erecta]SEU10718.1 Glycosyltransferase involved in cell wall bisynthesis [Stigmatella erecta]
MKIAHINWIALPTAGGDAVHIGKLVQELRRLGATTEVFAGTRGALDAHYLEALDLLAEPSDEQRALEELLQAVQGFDVVQLHNSQFHRPAMTRRLIDGLLAQPRPPRLVHNMHCMTDAEAGWDVLRHRGLPIIAHSRYIADETRRKIPRAEIHEVFLSLTMSQSAYAFPPVSGKLILQPTRLSRWKGSAISLQAVLELLEAGREDFTFFHAGKDQRIFPTGLDEALLARVAPWQERRRIHFIHYSVEQSWEAIRQADFLLHPTIDGGSQGEPFSLAAAQTVMLGKPVIATDSGNLPIMLGGYGPKQIIPIQDVGALRDAIAAWLDRGVPASTEADRALGETLRQGFLRSAEEHLHLYERLLGPGLSEVGAVLGMDD